MNHVTRTLLVAAVAVLSTSAAHARDATGAAMTATPGAGSGTPNSLTQQGYGSPGTTGAQAGAGSSFRANSTANLSKGGKLNGLNKGTNSGANSDVNRGLHDAP
ncbi:hypothetical protein [Paraburkholderia sp. BCC1886]|uniref:hypothetical protein n=1 Tax=Paraburkholderia sp. BCC1886 TaxID=2562670 RepID=UPI00118391D5|nr:hypothetical protein [Paraburkholderia sp. BCC1886]